MKTKLDLRHWWRTSQLSKVEEWPAFLYELARRTKRDMMKNPKSYPPWPDRSATWRRITVGRIPPLRDDIRNPPFQAVDHCAEAAVLLQIWKGGSDIMAMRVNLYSSDATIIGGFKKWLAGQRISHKIEPPTPNKGQKKNWKPWANIEALDVTFMDGDHSKSSRKSRSLHILPERYLTNDIMSVLLRPEPK